MTATVPLAQRGAALLPSGSATLPAAGGVGGAARPADGNAENSSLTEARLRAGLTKTAMARLLHVSRPTVSMWENGARAPARVYWQALGTALDLDQEAVERLFAASPSSRHDGRRLPALSRARRRARLTQRELAARLGVAPTTLSMWESAGVPVPRALLAQVGQLLATDLEDLARMPRPEPPIPDPRRLRAMRLKAHMSQREAAAHLRISVGALARYEAEERATPVPVVRRMAAAYRRTYDEVLRCSGTEVPPLPPGPWSADDLPEVLQALRSSAGLTKAGVGRVVRRSGQAVSSWEAGRSRPTSATLRQLESIYGLRRGRLSALGLHRTRGGADGSGTGAAGEVPTETAAGMRVL